MQHTESIFFAMTTVIASAILLWKEAKNSAKVKHLQVEVAKLTEKNKELNERIRNLVKLTK